MKVVFFANTDWYLYNFRREHAQALRQRGDDVVLVSPPGEYMVRLQGLGLRCLPFPFSRQGMNPVAELSTIVRLIRLYRDEKPDLVHHFTVKCVLYGTLAAYLAGVRAVVNSITGLGYIFTPGGVWKKFLRFFVRLWYRLILRGSQVIFENDDDRRIFRDAGLIPEDSGYFIPGEGVDMQRFAVRPLPEGEPVILLAARLLWDKGIGEYVQAARLLRSEGVQVRFILAGRTDPANPSSIPDAQIQAWRDEGVIEWWGWIEDMALTLRQVSIVCLPSYREGLPPMLMEAAACGRSIVATDVPGCRSTVRNGVNGLLVPVRDAASLAGALRTLINDPALCRTMGAAGRQLAEEIFSSEKAIKDIFKIYDRALTTKQAQ